MSAIAASFFGYTIKAVIFAAIAYAGIICGKKFKDSRASKSKGVVSEAAGQQK